MRCFFGNSRLADDSNLFASWNIVLWQTSSQYHTDLEHSQAGPGSGSSIDMHRLCIDYDHRSCLQFVAFYCHPTGDVRHDLCNVCRNALPFGGHGGGAERRKSVISHDFTWSHYGGVPISAWNLHDYLQHLKARMVSYTCLAAKLQCWHTSQNDPQSWYKEPALVL